MRLELTKWSDSFANSVGIALGSDSLFIQQEVESGQCQVWEFIDGDIILGHAVTRLEKDTLVVVAYEGENVQSFGDLIVRVCELKGLPYARFHTQRPGLIKLLRELEPEPLEYVIRVHCNGRT